MGLNSRLRLFCMTWKGGGILSVLRAGEKLLFPLRNAWFYLICPQIVFFYKLKYLSFLASQGRLFFSAPPIIFINLLCVFFQVYSNLLKKIEQPDVNEKRICFRAYNVNIFISNTVDSNSYHRIVFFHKCHTKLISVYYPLWPTFCSLLSCRQFIPQQNVCKIERSRRLVW